MVTHWGFLLPGFAHNTCLYFYNSKPLNISIFQGLAITAANLAIYQYAVYFWHNEDSSWTMVFITLISANIFLTLVNRSFYYSVIASLQYKNNLLVGILITTIALVCIILFVAFINHFFKFEIPDVSETIISIAAGFYSVIWIEFYKFIKRKKVNNGFLLSKTPELVTKQQNKK